MKILIAALLFSTALAAQPKPKAKPSKVFDKEAVLGLAPFYAALAADSLTTRHALASGHCIETSPLYGPNPSLRRQVIITSAEAVGMTALSLTFKRVLRRNTDGTRHMWLLFPSILAGGHGIAAFANSQNRCY